MILLCTMKRTHSYSGLCDSVGVVDTQDLNFVFYMVVSRTGLYSDRHINHCELLWHYPLIITSDHTYSPLNQH
jgi:hypothetical protein